MYTQQESNIEIRYSPSARCAKVDEEPEKADSTKSYSQSANPILYNSPLRGKISLHKCHRLWRPVERPSRTPTVVEYSEGLDEGYEQNPESGYHPQALSCPPAGDRCVVLKIS